MSVLIKLKNLNNYQNELIFNHLQIKKQFDEEKNNNFITNTEDINLFKKYTINNEYCLAIPKSFHYQYLQTIPSALYTLYPKININNCNINLLPRQLEIREETLNILNNSKSLLLSLYTGFGKTIFAIYLLFKIKLKTIILCHRNIIIKQWVDSINKYLPDLDIYILDNKPNNKTRIIECDIMIANPINIPKLELNNYLNFGLLIIDEVHTICTESFSKCLFYIFPKYMIGLSATPERSDGMDKIIQYFIGPDVIVKKMSREFNVYKFQTGIKIESKLTSQGTIDWNSVLDIQCNNQKRNNIIVNLVRYFINRTILILVKRKDHALLLKKLLLENDIDEKDIDTFFGTKKFCNYDCKILIATYSKGGVGFDFPRLDMLITAADVEAGFQQYIGRIFRRDDTTPIYIDLLDENNIIKKHSKVRTKVCKENGGLIKNFHKIFPTFFQLF